MLEPEPAATLAGARLDRYYHACAFFRSREEEYRVVLPFVKEGLDRGEKALHITDPELCTDHLQRLEAEGIELAAAERTGQLQVLGWDEAYLRDGRFEVSAMLTLVDEALRASVAEGFPRTRIIGHAVTASLGTDCIASCCWRMEWALEDRPGANELLEYEALVNDVLAKYRGPAVCAYDLTRFSAEMLLDVLRTHPMVIIGGTMRENPFFVPPAEFLRELRERN